MKVAITGEKGFLGIHLTNYFKYVLKYEVIELGKEYLESLSQVKDLDWLIHAAFVHRNPDPNKLIELNERLTNDTIKSLIKGNVNTNIMFLSSVHEDIESPYGKSKKKAKESLHDYCEKINKKFVSLKLPNIFGGFAKPNRTSFIATFCYNFYNNIQSTYNKNEIALCYVDDIVKIIGAFSFQDIPTTQTTVESVYFLLKNFNDDRLKNKFTSLNSKFESDLFQTYKKYANYKL